MTTEEKERKWIAVAKNVHQILKVYSANTGIPLNTLIEDYAKQLLKGGERDDLQPTQTPAR